jgi:protein-S-isoprenylcysteine O-methyltransferase Ste14
MAKEIDFPPVWLAGFAAAGGILGRLLPLHLAWNPAAGALLVGLGLALMALAVIQMMMARTTIIPRRDPAALVTGGIFRLSRNPIYLGDALLLAGLFVYWDALIALPLVAVFLMVIERRFIRAEEARLAEHFGAAFADYAARTRRWI